MIVAIKGIADQISLYGFVDIDLISGLCFLIDYVGRSPRTLTVDPSTALIQRAYRICLDGFKIKSGSYRCLFHNQCNLIILNNH